MVTLRSTWLAIRWPSHHAKKKHFHIGLSRDAVTGAGDLSAVSADLAWARLESPAVPTKPSEDGASAMLAFSFPSQWQQTRGLSLQVAAHCVPAQDTPPCLPVTSGTCDLLGFPYQPVTEACILGGPCG